MEMQLTAEKKCRSMDDAVEMLVRVRAPFPTLDAFNAFKAGAHDDVVAIFVKHGLPTDCPLTRQTVQKIEAVTLSAEEDRSIAAALTEMMETWRKSVEMVTRTACLSLQDADGPNLLVRAQKEGEEGEGGEEGGEGEMEGNSAEEHAT